MFGAFTIKDNSGKSHEVMLVRNAHGKTYYNGAWDDKDPRWADAKIREQVPYGVDPRDGSKHGLLVIPKSSLGPCFEYTTIAHYRDDEGYTMKWFDFEDKPLTVAKDSNNQRFYFTPTSNKDDLYVSLHLYASLFANPHIEDDFIDKCMTGTYTWNDHQAFLDNEEKLVTETVTGPKLHLTLHNEKGTVLYRRGNKIDNQILMKKGSYSAKKYFLQVYTETWAGLPQIARDYTVRTYSKGGYDVFNYVRDDLNMLRRDII